MNVPIMRNMKKDACLITNAKSLRVSDVRILRKAFSADRNINTDNQAITMRKSLGNIPKYARNSRANCTGLTLTVAGFAIRQYHQILFTAKDVGKFKNARLKESGPEGIDVTLLWAKMEN